MPRKTNKTNEPDSCLAAYESAALPTELPRPDVRRQSCGMRDCVRHASLPAAIACATITIDIRNSTMKVGHLRSGEGRECKSRYAGYSIRLSSIHND
jgi:hypothetical protein